jgi:thiol-disulfide isomerase/thioredoxin
MRVVSCMIVVVCLSAALTGCSLFKKNANNNGASGQGGAVPPKFPDPLLNSNTPQPPQFPTNPGAGATPAVPMSGSSLLAGTIVDAYHRPIGNAYVRWINLEEKEKDGAPIDVAANANGHFIIQGLKPGVSYKLIARTKLGDKMLAGTALTTAPNVRVVIPISEDRVNSSIPPMPGTPAVQGAAEGVGLVAPKPGGEPDLPHAIAVPSSPTNKPVANPTPATNDPAFVPGVVGVPRDRLPLLNIPRADLPKPSLPTDAKFDAAARVPSCVIVGSRVESLALKDSKGQTWDYRKQGAGKIVLIDFWRTTCMPCKDMIPILNRLHQQYGSRGLEVVGIALESGQDERREAEAVAKYCTSMKVNYRQLMGRTPTFDAGGPSNFKVQGVPTVILLSDQGDVIFHHVGVPDPDTLSELERTIQFRLAQRPADAARQ